MVLDAILEGPHVVIVKILDYHRVQLSTVNSDIRLLICLARSMLDRDMESGMEIPDNSQSNSYRDAIYASMVLPILLCLCLGVYH